MPTAKRKHDNAEIRIRNDNRTDSALWAPHAAEPQSCKTVRFSDVGSTDITSITVVATSKRLATLSKLLSIPVSYTSMKNKDIDVYLGDWEPSMEVDRKPYLDEKAIEVIGPNLTDAKYMFAVPNYVDAAGDTDCRSQQIRRQIRQKDLRHRAEQQRQSHSSRLYR